MKKYFSIISAVLALLFLLASCGSTSSSQDKSDEGYYSGGESVTSDELMPENPDGNGSMMVYSVYYRTETINFDSDCKKYENEAKLTGGYIVNYDISTENTKYASYTFKIPTDKLDSFLAAMDKIGNVLDKTNNATDYSGQYYDYQTEIDLLKVEEKYITDYLESAVDSAERTSLIQQLLDVKRQIKYLQMEMEDVEQMVAYSTVSLSVTEVESYSDINVAYKDSLSYAFYRGWEGFVNFGKGLLYTVILIMPVIVSAAVIIVIIVVVSKTKKRKKAKAAAKSNQTIQNK